MLVLLPGLDGTGDLFAPVVDALGPNVPTQIVRYPLSHASDYPTCEAVARGALPTDCPYVLLGESFSGPIAVSIAAAAPPGLRGLILCSTFVCNPQPCLRPLRPGALHKHFRDRGAVGQPASIFRRRLSPKLISHCRRKLPRGGNRKAPIRSRNCSPIVAPRG